MPVRPRSGFNTYENIASGGATTTLTAVAPIGTPRFFAVVEKDPPPPLFSNPPHTRSLSRCPAVRSQTNPKSDFLSILSITDFNHQ